MEITEEEMLSPELWLTKQGVVLLLTYLLTYSMVQSPSWEANWFAASQEIPCISRNPKVHYRTHKRPPTVSILGQLNPVHIPTSHLLDIHPNIIHTSTPRSPQWSSSLRFPHQDPIHLLSSPIRATCPANHIYIAYIFDVQLFLRSGYSPLKHSHRGRWAEVRIENSIIDIITKLWV